jgi:hypothetical protein
VEGRFGKHAKNKRGTNQGTEIVVKDIKQKGYEMRCTRNKAPMDKKANGNYK